ncbi:MAG TPA: hypothetical protein VIM73_14855 [Polyangiaceae bacterium]
MMKVSVAALAMVVAGCSFTFTDTVPERHAHMKYFDCTSTPGLAVADGFLAVSSVVAAATTFSKSEEEYKAYNNDASRDLVGGLTVAQGIVFAASGMYGLVHSQRCRGAKRDLRARLEREELTAPIRRSPTRPPAPAAPSLPSPAAPVPAPSGTEPVQNGAVPAPPPAAPSEAPAPPAPSEQPPPGSTPW